MKRNIYLICLLSFFNSAMLVAPVLVIYHEVQKGVDFSGFLLGQAAFAFMMLLMGIPAGYLSDVWKRRSILFLGMAIQAAGYALMWGASGLFWMVCAQTVIGMGLSFISGTSFAVMHETLKDLGREKDSSRYNGYMYSCGMVASALTALAGGFLYSENVHLPVLFTIVTFSLGALCALGVKEPIFHRKRPEIHPILDMIQVTKYAVHGHKEVACLMLFMTSVFVTTNLAFWVHQRYWIDGGVTEGMFGVLFAIGATFNALGAFVAHRIEAKVSFKSMVLIIAGLPLLAYSLAVVLPYTIGLFALFIGGVAWGMGSPLMIAAVNRRVEDSRRATVLSVKGLLHRVTFLPLTFIIGHLADAYNAKMALIGLLIFMFLGVLVSFICMAKHDMFKT